MVRRFLCGQLALTNNYRRTLLTKGQAKNVINSATAAGIFSTTTATLTAHRFSNSSVKCSQSFFGLTRSSVLQRSPISSQHSFSKKFSTSAAPNIVTFNLADIGEGISEVVIKEWFVKEGDKVAQFDAICEVQSDKASVTITSRYDGMVHKIYYGVNDVANVGKPLVDIRLEGSRSAPESVLSEEPFSKVSPSGVNAESQVPRFKDEYSISSEILTTPAVRRLAIEHKINLKDVTGTGKEGRILKEDVLNYIVMSEQKPVASSTILTHSQTKPVGKVEATKAIPEATRNKTLPVDRTEPIKGITKSMFKTMTQSLQVPHFGLGDEIDLTALVDLKPELKKVGAERSISVSYMPFMIKAVSLALNDFPILNAHIDKAGENIVYKGSHNVGVAIDTKQGLLVPNIKGVNGLTVVEIAQELNRLYQLAQAGQLGTADLSGGTFTLSNIGSIGGVFGIPVLMPSEVAIGAIGRAVQVPRFVDENSNNIRRAHVIHVLWSADHRIIDGATMTRFNNHFKSLLENPIQILLA